MPLAVSGCELLGAMFHAAGLLELHRSCLGLLESGGCEPTSCSYIAPKSNLRPPDNHIAAHGHGLHHYCNQERHLLNCLA